VRRACSEEPGGGIPVYRPSTVVAMASLSVDAAGKVARAFDAAPRLR
jgi:hypothetical protein